MSLRMRLVLRIGIVFFVAFFVSTLFETYLTNKHLTEAENVLKDKLLKQGETKREKLEQLLTELLSEGQAKVISILQQVAEYPVVKGSIAPSDENLQRGTWVDVGFLLLTNGWIDFLQNTNQGRLSSLIIPNNQFKKEALRFTIDKTSAWIRIGDQIFLGIIFNVGLKKREEAQANAAPSQTIDKFPESYVLFDWRSFINANLQANPSFQFPYAMPEGYQDDLMIFLENLKKAQAYLKSANASDEKKMKDWVEKELVRLETKNSSSQEAICQIESDPSLTTHLKLLRERNEQNIMIWSICSALATGILGDSPFDKNAPVGSARFANDAKSGSGIFVSEVFFDKPLFEDGSYYQSHSSSSACDEIAGSIAIITPTSHPFAFLGNTSKITEPSLTDRSGYFTIGVNVDTVMQDLVLSSGEKVLLVHNEKVVSGLDENGNKIPTDAFSNLNLKEMIAQKDGCVILEGIDYYFLHAQPFKTIDLHYFFLNPEKEEFMYVNDLHEGTKRVIDSLSFNLRIIALIALGYALLAVSNISRLITRPISLLAKASTDVAAGKLDEVNLPPLRSKRRDEIYTLYASFEEMIKGLQEKEKVKGVLNKVVSEEIAQEILKGNIHLGGEVKRVTMLFADIRNFTKITEHMSPEETIEMLNTCMTKVSQHIDAHGGVIDKFVGDEVMALFGAPIEREDNALQAINCAKAIVEELKKWNDERRAAGLVPIEMGIGIHTGDVLAGNMGAEKRLNYTVIGANVNKAARLCSAAKGMQVLISQETLDAQILITKETLNAPHVKENIRVHEMPPMALKGFEEKSTVYEVEL